MATHNRTIEAPGARIGYDVHGELGPAVPLFLLGSPMAAAEFGALAARFTDRPVITYDPRGVGRSVRTDGADRTEVAEHADDLRRVLDDLGVDAIDLFASSGGAVNALALVQQGHPAVRTLVAHEPPIVEYLPDRDAVAGTITALRETYLRDGYGPAMAKFIDMIMVAGPLPDDYASRPGPDPAAFGLPVDGDGRALFLLNRDTTAFVPDLDALRATPTRLVIGYGGASAEQVPGRAAIALAARLGLTPTEFPSHHGGFVDGNGGDPDAFAARLRAIL